MSDATSFLALVQAADGPVQAAAQERLHVWGPYAFSDPWFLALVPAAALAVAWGARGAARGRVGALPAKSLPGSLASSFGWLVPGLRFAALALLAIALARPLRSNVETTSTSEGVDIALVIDRSGSMEYKDLDPARTRLEVVKEVVRDFAVRRMTDRTGAADNVGLITFAAYPQLLCPFTLDVDAITGFLEQLVPVRNRAEDGTGIGVGLAKAVQVLATTPAKSKVVVLLTDGENNIDTIAPEDAADLAAREKVRVHTIFAGRFVYTVDVFGRQTPTDRPIDTTLLEKIASTTGGKFFRARDKTELEAIYSEIERMERTRREERQLTQSYDLYPWFLAPALACQLLALLFAATWLRRIP